MSRADAPSHQVEKLPYDEREEDYQEFEEYDEATKPQSRPFYKRRKYWIFCAILTVIIVAVAVPIALYVIFPKVAQTILDHSTMSFKSIQITNPTNNAMDMSLDGLLGNTGPFAATIKFPEPIEVYYNDALLGSMNLPDTKASGGKGALNAQAAFSINDESVFGSFSADMVSSLFSCIDNRPHFISPFLPPPPCISTRVVEVEVLSFFSARSQHPVHFTPTYPHQYSSPLIHDITSPSLSLSNYRATIHL